MLFINKRKGLLIHPTAWRKNKMHYVKLQKPVPKGYILYDFIFMTIWKGQNYRQKHVSSCEELTKKGDQRGPQESFRELWCILTLIVVTWCMHLSKLRKVHWQEWTLLNVNYILTNLTRGKKKNSLNYKHKNQHIP